MDKKKEDGPQRGLFKELSGHHFIKERAALRDLVKNEELATAAGGHLLAQFDAGVCYGAGHWALGLAGRFHNSLRADEYGAAARRRFCLTIPALRAQPRCPFPDCSERLDAHGWHIFACSGSQQKKRDQRAHNEVRDHLFGVCKQAGLHPQLETPRLVDGTFERPADVLLPAGHGLGGPAVASFVACLDVSGVRSECASYMAQGLHAPLAARQAEKAKREFTPSSEALTAAAVAAAGALAAATAAGAGPEAAVQARDAAHHQALAMRAPPLYLEPIVFSSTGCFFDGEKGRGLRAVLAALGASYRRSECDMAEGAGTQAVRSRWLPRLSAAVERGVWWRIKYTLQALDWRAAPEVDAHMVLSDLSCYSAARAFPTPSF